MEIRFEGLPQHLKRSLAPVYLISGDEPLQMMEAMDLLRAKGKEAGFTLRKVVEIRADSDWDQLEAAVDNLSLFGEKELLDLRLVKPVVGTIGAKALTAYVERLAADQLLLVSMPRLDSRQMKSNWVSVLERAGVLLRIWTVETNQLPLWISQRMRAAGLLPGPGVAELLAERIEGNLLAAVQEIEKLLLLYGPGEIDLRKLADSVGDSSRFDSFGLVDTFLAGQVGRGLRILENLQGEAVAPSLILWSISRDIRSLSAMAFEVQQGRPFENLVSGRNSQEKRQRAQLIRPGLQRGVAAWRRMLIECARIDRAIKGLETVDEWLLMRNLLLTVAGHSLVRELS